MHRALNGTKKKNSSIIYKSFLGSTRIYTRKIPPTELDDKQKRSLLATPEYKEVVTDSPFLYLTCDLPPPPLFIDEFRENIIPQVYVFSFPILISLTLLICRSICINYYKSLMDQVKENTKLTKKTS